MDLFDLPDKQKEVLEDGSIVIHLKSNSKYDITIKNNFVRVKTRGALNFLNKGLVGEKTYNLDTVTGVQIKEPGLTTGYMAIQTMGTFDVKGGVTKAVKDENSILFTKKESHLINQIKEYIETYLTQKNQPQQVVQQTSNLDELKKLKELLDIGAITQQEFDQQKQRLLGASVQGQQSSEQVFDFSGLN